MDLLPSCSFTFSKNASIFYNVVCAKYWKKLKINILGKCYHKRFINFAAQIAGKKMTIFSLFHEENKQKIIWHQNNNIYFHEVKFSVRYFEISAKKTIGFPFYKRKKTLYPPLLHSALYYLKSDGQIISNHTDIITGPWNFLEPHILTNAVLQTQTYCSSEHLKSPYQMTYTFRNLWPIKLAWPWFSGVKIFSIFG